MNFTATALSYSFSYAKFLQEKLYSQQRDMATTQPDSQKLIHARNIPDKIPGRNTRTKP